MRRSTPRHPRTDTLFTYTTPSRSVVGDRIDAAAARRQHHHPDATQHRGQRQGDDQPDHRPAQRVATLVVRRVPVVVFGVPHIGPKKVLSTVSLASPATPRSEEPRVGTECVGQCRVRWWATNIKKKRKTK